MAVAPGRVECKDARLHARGVDTLLPTRVLPPLALWTGSVCGGFETNLQDVTTDGMNGGNVHLAKSKQKHFTSCPFDFQIAPGSLFNVRSCTPVFAPQLPWCGTRDPVSDFEDF